MMKNAKKNGFLNNRILILILCVVMLSTYSCGGVEYTRELPYTVDLNGYEIPETIKLENNGFVYDDRSIDSFLYYYDEGKLIGTPEVILLANAVNSTSYYWKQEGNVEVGYTITELKIEEVLEKGGTCTESLKSGDIIECVQLFTVQPNGKIAFPRYMVGLNHDKYLSTQHSRKIMEVGKQYAFFCSGILRSSELGGSFISSGEGGVYPGDLYCFYPTLFGGYSEGGILNKGETTLEGNASIVGKYYGRGYEFSEEAYEASKAIVEEYEAEGKTMTDGSYYHYHGMVVEAWERYSGNANINDSE